MMLSTKLIKDIVDVLYSMGHIRGTVDIDQVYSEIIQKYSHQADKLSFGQETNRVITDYDAGDEVGH